MTVVKRDKSGVIIDLNSVIKFVNTVEKSVEFWSLFFSELLLNCRLLEVT